MAEYLIFHGSFASGRDADSPGLISFMSDGQNITLKGNKKEVDAWSKIVERSTPISVTALTEPHNVLWRFMNANKMASWSYFTDDNGYDKYSHIYDNVKGSTAKIKIVPREYGTTIKPRSR